MGRFDLSQPLLVSLLLAAAVNVESTLTSHLRRAQPKAGLAVTLVGNLDNYEAECTKGSLLPLFDPGTKGTIKDVDEDGEGSVMMKADNGDEAWVPIRALVGFESWRKGQPNPDPATRPGPGAPTGPNGPYNAFAPAPAINYTPSDYMPGGCQHLDVEVKHGYTRQAGMTPTFCFSHCRKTKGNRYFGLTKGGVCFCSKLPIGEKVSSKLCDAKCSGDVRKTCGGIGAATVYTMMNCGSNNPQHLQSERSQKLASLYGSMKGQSCGQSRNNVAELNGSTKMNGTPDECKLACWDAKGADRCNGFTYNSIVGRCTFFKDVLNGKTTKAETLTCYFKETGFPY